MPSFTKDGTGGYETARNYETCELLSGVRFISFERAGLVTMLLFSKFPQRRMLCEGENDGTFGGATPADKTSLNRELFLLAEARMARVGRERLCANAVTGGATTVSAKKGFRGGTKVQ